ncbi:hypothetical protein [Amycolatopsis antarctica]|uniref:hypothetical protein n=1 Tax=Amycolatopsis antarctica TaxID=1854586 RepID=UPI0013FDC993|nr:hypothetical protein [Amycolatopsis antarctica]
MSTTIEAETIDELIADCADIPSSLRVETDVPRPVLVALPWSVDDACHAQVADLDLYV